MKRFFTQMVRGSLRRLFQFLPGDLRRKLTMDLLDWSVQGLPPREALRNLFLVDNLLYGLQGRYSRKLGEGIHSKHEHLNYSAFFSARINPGERALDIGCGNGHMAFRIASERPEIEITGLELDRQNFEFARSHHRLPNLSFVQGDALQSFPPGPFEVVLLSAVLEHFEHRVELLGRIRRELSPRRIVIRVPTFQRDWRVPLKQELGVDYRLDATHFIEYTIESFGGEMERAGLKIAHLEVRWGEIWSVVEPVAC